MTIRSNVDARKLDQRIAFQRKINTQDISTGAMTPTWFTQINCWAAVDAATAKEVIAANAVQSIQDYVVWVRSDIISRFVITQADRILWGSTVLEILGIPNQQLRGNLITVICRAGSSDG